MSYMDCLKDNPEFRIIANWLNVAGKAVVKSNTDFDKNAIKIKAKSL